MAESAKSKHKVKVRLYEYRAFPGRPFLVGRARFLASDARIAKALKSNSIDLQREVLLSAKDASIEDMGRLYGKLHRLRTQQGRDPILGRPRLLPLCERHFLSRVTRIRGWKANTRL